MLDHAAKQTVVVARSRGCDWLPVDVVVSPPQAARVPPSRLTMRLLIIVLFNFDSMKVLGHPHSGYMVEPRSGRPVCCVFRLNGSEKL